ncbi:MAG TPA: DUF2934 domain-containing protein [Bryobacterales bacterium]|nr:DUF2934 domain-containing protein [Bryobacterales bacterium]
MKTASEKPRISRKPKEPVAASLEWSEEQRQQIARLAYQRFIARGAEHGHAMEDWLAAEAELVTSLNSKPRRISRGTEKGPSLVPPRASRETAQQAKA